jgi:hypothetical protein
MREERLELNPSLQRYRTLYQAIRAIPRVSSVELKQPRLELVTEPLFGCDKSGNWHRIGPLRTSYDLRSPSVSSFTWENLDGPKQGYHAPPNITTGKQSNCMGPGANKVASDAAEARDHLAICKLLVRFPECCGKTSVIEHWPVVPEDAVPAWYRETAFEKITVPDPNEFG